MNRFLRSRNLESCLSCALCIFMGLRIPEAMIFVAHWVSQRSCAGTFALPANWRYVFALACSSNLSTSSFSALRVFVPGAEKDFDGSSMPIWLAMVSLWWGSSSYIFHHHVNPRFCLTFCSVCRHSRGDPGLPGCSAQIVSSMSPASRRKSGSAASTAKSSPRSTSLLSFSLR